MYQPAIRAAGTYLYHINTFLSRSVRNVYAYIYPYNILYSTPLVYDRTEDSFFHKEEEFG